jgi:DeoR/GlpR family transcriptional regulator of sugar metabolism
LERMLYLLRQLHVGNVLNMKEVAFELKATEKNIRRDMLLLEEKGWIISGGTTSNRTYQLSEQAIEQLNALDSD